MHRTPFRFQTYVHLSGRDMDGALLKLHNIQAPDDGKAGDGFMLRPCRRCEFQNPPANRFCSRRGTALDDRAADDLIRHQFNLRRADGVMDRLVQDPEFREMLWRKIGELGSDAACPGAGEPASQTLTPSSHERLFLSCPSTSSMSGTGQTSRPSSFSQ
jgi:hypothetical protein